MELSKELVERVEQMSELSRWERSELGKDLRRVGLSYGEIAELLLVPKSTVATWSRGIDLSEEQQKAIRERTGSRAGIPRDTQWRRRDEVAKLRAEAREEVAGLLMSPLWVAGTVMYWGEGDKVSRRLALANSDPAAHRLFVSWVRRHHDPAAEFVLALHLHEGNDEWAAKLWWSRVLALPDVRFHKTYIKPLKSGQRKNTLLHGVCRTLVRSSTDHFLRTMAWISVLPDHLGFSHQGVAGTLSSGR